jgi:hypothetical protein
LFKGKLIFHTNVLRTKKKLIKQGLQIQEQDEMVYQKEYGLKTGPCTLIIMNSHLTEQNNNLRKWQKIVQQLIKSYLFYGRLVVEIRQRVQFVRWQSFDLNKPELKSTPGMRINWNRKGICSFQLKVKKKPTVETIGLVR